MTHSHSKFLGDVCPDVGSVDLVGTSVLNVGETGFFRCTSINSIQLFLTLDGVSIFFTGVDVVGANINREKLSITAYLVDVNVDKTGIIGNRTAVLVYTPPPGLVGSVAISCDGGIVNAQCVGSVEVLGKVLYLFFKYMLYLQ